MGMFSRMNDIVQANINAMLDKAEDPKKVIRLIIQEMEETLVELRSVAARNLAQQKHLDRKQMTYKKELKNWQSKAELAMQKGREELARAALAEKHAIQAKLDAIATEHQAVNEALSKLQDDTARLQAKLTEARNKQRAMEVRHQSATVRLKAKDKQSEVKIDDAMARFDAFEQRIDYLEAQVDAYDVVSPQGQDLNAQFAALEAQDDIEKELESLRKKVA
ncbi:phage shock protein PspA [Aestuariibacter salexigens]|uniref:phage shock protein PspA n=1 Tax=Aestuariibacter salexigens TaxID=226010 RepID=UPI00040AC32D|nr:phage shock protein PspA [Aestuariibacter salexigens]